jgi:hypothetical protein
MKELMTYVEGIIRPIRAFAPRKLRMRRELLGHLQDALQDEQQQQPEDGSTALDRARRRLGEPGELTRQLQQTVPVVERLLMTSLPLPKKIEQAEQRAARRLYGNCGPMTLGHQCALSFLAACCVAPWYAPNSVRDALQRTGTPAHVTVFFIGIMISLWVMLLVSSRLVRAAAEPAPRLWRPRVLKLGAALFALQIAYLFFIAAAAANRLPTVRDIVIGVAVIVPVLLCAILLARQVSHLRKQYDEWLTLDVSA